MSRLDQLPAYVFSSIDQAKRRALEAGVAVHDLGVGDPDRPTPQVLVDRLARAVEDPAGHAYPAQRGTRRLREVVAQWLARRYGVTVDPENQILVLIGSKEGLAHLPLAFLDNGEQALVPDLGYPVYERSVILAGGRTRRFALGAARNFRPDPGELAGLLEPATRLIYCNYPNNPTGAVVDGAFWREAAALAARHGAVLVNDAAYQEVNLGEQRPVSLLEAVNAREYPVIELHSLSKMFNMTGWRIGFAVGHPQVVEALARVKESCDSGVFTPIQEVAAHALGPGCEALLQEVMAVYPPRRRILVEALQAAGFEVFPSEHTFYLWCRVPGGEGSLDFCSRVLSATGVVLTPGLGFGPGGEGWFRISLTAADETVAAAAAQIESWQ